MTAPRIAGTRPAFFSRLLQPAPIDDTLVLLCGFLGAVSFWSTALAETTGGLILALSAVRLLVSGREGTPLEFCRGRDAQIAFALFALYAAAVVVSFLRAPTPFLRNPSLLWHPLILPALLVPVVRRRAIIRAAMLFIAGGAASSVATLAINFAGNREAEPFTFTGMTTFADLLVIAGAAGVSTVLPASRLRFRSWMLAGSAMVLPAIAWSGERAPVLVAAGLGTARAARGGIALLLAWLCIAGACMAFAPSAFTEKMDWMMHGGQIDRYVIWEEGVRLAPGTPLFGYGPGSFARILPRGAWGRFMQRPPASWHNDMLETWLGSGPLAALALAGLIVVGCVQTVRGLAAALRGRGRASAAETGILFVILALFGGVGSVVTTSLLGMAFWVLLALTLNPPE